MAKKFKCPACGEKPIEDKKCPNCGNNDPKIPLPSPGSPKKNPALTLAKLKTIRFVCESETIGEKYKGKAIPPHVKNSDILEYLPDRIKLNSILGGSDFVLLNPSQIISAETLIIKKNQMDIQTVFFKKKKNFSLKKDGMNVTSEEFDLHIGEKLNIESMLIYLEVSS